nr:atherin-like [Camelus dromedarius]
MKYNPFSQFLATGSQEIRFRFSICLLITVHTWCQVKQAATELSHNLLSNRACKRATSSHKGLQRTRGGTETPVPFTTVNADADDKARPSGTSERCTGPLWPTQPQPRHPAGGLTRCFWAVPGSLSAARDPLRAHTDRGAGAPTPVITLQCRQLRGPAKTASATQRERRALPRRRAGRQAGAGGRGARGVQRGARKQKRRRAPRRARDPAPPGPGPGLRPLRPPASREAAEGLAPRSDGAPAGPARPGPTAAGSTAASAVSPAAPPRRSARPARSAAVAATRLPFSLVQKTRSAVAVAPVRGPSPAAARGPGASPPPPPALRSPLATLRSARRAQRPPPGSARSRQRARPLTVTGSSCAPHPPAGTCARPAPAPPTRSR